MMEQSNHIIEGSIQAGADAIGDGLGAPLLSNKSYFEGERNTMMAGSIHDE